MTPKYKRLDLVTHKTFKNWVKVPIMQIDDWFEIDLKSQGKIIVYKCCWFTDDKKYNEANFGEDELELV